MLVGGYLEFRLLLIYPYTHPRCPFHLPLHAPCHILLHSPFDSLLRQNPFPETPNLKPLSLRETFTPQGVNMFRAVVGSLTYWSLVRTTGTIITTEFPYCLLTLNNYHDSRATLHMNVKGLQALATALHLTLPFRAGLGFGFRV